MSHLIYEYSSPGILLAGRFKSSVRIDSGATVVKWENGLTC